MKTKLYRKFKLSALLNLLFVNPILDDDIRMESWHWWCAFCRSTKTEKNDFFVFTNGALLLPWAYQVYPRTVFLLLSRLTLQRSEKFCKGPLCIHRRWRSDQYYGRCSPVRTRFGTWFCTHLYRQGACPLSLRKDCKFFHNWTWSWDRQQGTSPWLLARAQETWEK